MSTGESGRLAGRKYPENEPNYAIVLTRTVLGMVTLLGKMRTGRPPKQRSQYQESGIEAVEDQ